MADKIVNANTFFNDHTIPIYVDLFIHDNDVDIHTHPFIEFVYIDQGFSSHYCNGVTSILTPGDIFGIRPGDKHGYTRPQQTKLYNCLFYPESIKSDMAHVIKLPGIGNIFKMDGNYIWQRTHLNPRARKEILIYLEKMKLERKMRATGWEIKMRSLLLEFLVLISRAMEQQYTQDQNYQYEYTKYIYQALDFIEKNYANSIFVEQIASSVGLSSDYFSRIFKQFTGLTPMEYMKNIRMAKATELLKNPHITISQVAIEIGIDDPSYFTRQFKKVTGINPSQYQQSVNR